MTDARRPPPAAAEDAPAPADRLSEQALARHREALRERFPLPPARPHRRRAAAVTTLLLVLTGAALWCDPAYRHERYETAIGEQRRLALRDGSTVTLDTGSRLELSWHLRSRRAVLDGQALFDVARAAWRPFRVAAGDARVRVVGTAFNVREADGGASTLVTVLRGRVAVRAAADGGDELLLGIGERARVRAGQVSAEARVDTARGLPWTQGRLVFERTPLRDVLAEIQRYRRAPLTLTEPRLGALPLSGVFSVARSDDLLDLLPRMLPVRVERGADGAVRIDAAPAAAPAQAPQLVSPRGAPG
ncbi:MAG: FecR domain-containing protein [Solimonas sp.]